MCLQQKEKYSEAVTKHLSVAARQRQAAQASVLQSMVAAATLPFHVLAVLLVSVTKCLWSIVLFIAFLLTPVVQAPLCLLVGAMLLYTVYLGRLSIHQAAGVGISISVLVLLPASVRLAGALYRGQRSKSCASSLFISER